MKEKLDAAIDTYIEYLCAKYGGMREAIRNSTDFENDMIKYFDAENT